MNITFMIGNGFDLRLGMNTRYTDMYAEYLRKEPENETVKEFKDILHKAAPNGYETWCDFEMAMAEHAKQFKSEQELIICVRDFKKYMRNHLLTEQTLFREYLKRQKGIVPCIKEMQESLHEFHKGQTPNVIHTIEALGEPELANYKFITFNYTTLLDEFVGYYNKYNQTERAEKPIHIHGELDNDVVLGIDNILQFGQLPYILSKKGERAFVKPLFNSEFDKNRIIAAESAIEESDVICVYGMSLGSSDATWVNKIYEWLTRDPNHHLICYRYLKQKFEMWQRDEKMDEEDIQRDILLKKLCGPEYPEKIENQVHIPIGYDIFDFRLAIDSAAELNRKNQTKMVGSMKSY